jgi:hypothetical protein
MKVLSLMVRRPPHQIFSAFLTTRTLSRAKSGSPLADAPIGVGFGELEVGADDLELDGGTSDDHEKSILT